jgi:hypothetical protein
MEITEYSYGVCGLFCEQCKKGNGRIKELARELKRLTAEIDDWPGFNEFDFGEFQRGLEWLDGGLECPTCLEREEYGCGVMSCERAGELGSCLLCDEYAKCPHTEHMRVTFPVVLEHHGRVREVGLEQHFREERERAESGLLLDDIRK